MSSIHTRLLRSLAKFLKRFSENRIQFFLRQSIHHVSDMALSGLRDMLSLMRTKTFGERFKECLKSLSPTYEHCNITGHHTSVDNSSTVGGESQNLTKTIKKQYLLE